MDFCSKLSAVVADVKTNNLAKNLNNCLHSRIEAGYVIKLNLDFSNERLYIF